MKKWLYMLSGIIVTLCGIWMGVHWWNFLMPFLVGLVILFIFMAGIVILIVSFMTPAKEETFNDTDNLLNEDDKKDNGKNNTENTEDTKKEK